MQRQSRPFDILLFALCLSALLASIVWLQAGRIPGGEEFQGRRLELQLSSGPHTLKIMQLTDMHFGEDSWTDWGPRQDANTFKVLESIIPEEKPDLIVLSGDQLTANNIDKNATDVYRNVCKHLAKYKTPWAMIFGNHDDAPLEKPGEEEGTLLVTPAKTSREQLYEVDHSFAPLSLTEKGPTSLFGTSNYILNVDAPGGGKEVGLQLLFLDTGGGSLPKQLESNQVNWFHQHRKKDIPMIAFQHIPTKEFVHDGDRCEGLHDEDVDHIVKDPKMVDVLAKDGNVQFLAVGHNHGNDYCCSYKDMHLCYGRRTGYGGYGTWERGARVYEIEIQPDRGEKKKEQEEKKEKGTDAEVDEDTDEDKEEDKAPPVKWKSWVRLESGDIKEEYNPFEEKDTGWFGDW